MKTILIQILVLFIISEGINAQCGRIQKYAIGDSKCFAYFRNVPDSVETSKMEDGSLVYTTSASCDGLTYGILLVKFNQPIDSDKKGQIEMVENYCNLVKEMLNMVSCAGYGEGHQHAKNANAQGVIDYCSDGDENEAVFKAWIDANYAAILYVYVPKNSSDKNNYNIQELFLNGFRFPE